jgi:putative transposase
MHINGEKLPQTRKLAGLGKELSREALIRLAWFDFPRTHGKNVALTCRHFGISRQTFYTWRRRFDRFNLFSLEGGSHRPLHPRKPTWTSQMAQQVLVLRQRFPRWGKDKLVVLLAQQGLQLSTSMVGRILQNLRQRRLLIEPLNQELLAWETIYNTVRPHQALHYLTPHQFLLQWHSHRKD